MPAHLVHGHAGRESNSSEYRTWGSMKTRCSNPNFKDWDKYGGQGIKVCERWQSFENFLEDMGYKPSPQHTLDRINNNGDYTPENCRWATKKEQARNRRSSMSVLYKGQAFLLVELAEQRGISYGTIHARLINGWTVEDAVDTPVNSRKKGGPNLPPTMLEYGGRVQSIGEWSKETGIKKHTIRHRLLSGWSVKEVLYTSVDGRNSK